MGREEWTEMGSEKWTLFGLGMRGGGKGRGGVWGTLAVVAPRDPGAPPGRGGRGGVRGALAERPCRWARRPGTEGAERPERPGRRASRFIGGPPPRSPAARRGSSGPGPGAAPAPSRPAAASGSCYPGCSRCGSGGEAGRAGPPPSLHRPGSPPTPRTWTAASASEPAARAEETCRSDASVSKRPRTAPAVTDCPGIARLSSRRPSKRGRNANLPFANDDPGIGFAPGGEPLDSVVRFRRPRGVAFRWRRRPAGCRRTNAPPTAVRPVHVPGQAAAPTRPRANSER